MMVKNSIVILQIVCKLETKMKIRVRVNILKRIKIKLTKGMVIVGI